jgi:hypothetical protein
MRMFRFAGACALAALLLGASPAQTQNKVVRVSLNTELQVDTSKYPSLRRFREQSCRLRS